jgi:hypothetical protein
MATPVAGSPRYQSPLLPVKVSTLPTPRLSLDQTLTAQSILDHIRVKAGDLLPTIEEKLAQLSERANLAHMLASTASTSEGAALAANMYKRAQTGALLLGYVLVHRDKNDGHGMRFFPREIDSPTLGK